MSQSERKEVQIFNAALELSSPAERAAYLDKICATDEPLRRKVEALLAACGEADDFFRTVIAPSEPGGEGGTSSRPSGPRTTVVPVTEKAGDRIGRYKLLQQIGEGGCGVVFMAEQEEPVRRRVALKVIKLGMDTRQVVARFEAERQALALMDHPNIAKVLDAGATDTGRPYFVMELVRGVRLTEFCDENHLSMRQRLDLFVQVCHAVQHAHQKGIIHRDLKPSNILVTVNDGVPVPKVIDFGIAKATTGQQLTDKTLFTAFEQFIGTPAYMSPEQAVMTSLDIDTRSDIYSLGVLLYELLTGKTPFDAQELLAAGLDEMRRTIREKEPARPSTRLTLELVAADVRRRTAGQPDESASSPRRLQLKELIPALRGDLDWIVMKALEKDRARRYETANGFAADIQRHLNHEAVTARPPSLLYKFQKAVRRNKGAFAAAAAVLLALLTGLGLTAWQAVRAKKAEQAARRAEYAERIQSEQAHADRDRAILAESSATEKATVATNALQTANERMVKLNVAEGWRRVEEGDYFGALLPFAEAFALEQDKPDRAEIHQMRLTSVLQHCPKLVNVWSVGTNICNAEFSPDGERLLTFSALSWTQFVARIWDATTGQPLSVPMEHTNWITCIQWNADGRKVVTASYDQTARVWDGNSGRPLTPPLRHELPVVWAHFNSNGTRLVTAAWKEMKEDSSAALPLDELALWDAATGRQFWKTNAALLENEDYAIFAPDGDRIVTSMEVRRVVDGALVKTLFLFPAERHRFNGGLPMQTVTANRVVFSPDGSRLFVAPSPKRSWDSDRAQAALLEGRDLERTVEKLNASGRPRIVKFSPDGRRLATANEGYVTRVWDAATGAAISLPMRHGATINHLTFSPDGRWLATACENGFARIWNPESGEPISPLLHHSGSLVRIAFNAEGTQLLALGFDGTLRVWDFRTADVSRFSWRGSPHTVNGVPWAPTNRKPETPVINIGGSEPRLFSLSSGEPILPPLVSPDLGVHHWEWLDGDFSSDGSSVFGDNHEKDNAWYWMNWDIVTGKSWTNAVTITKSKKEHPIRSFVGNRRFVETGDEKLSHYDGIAFRTVQATSNSQVVFEAMLRTLEFSRNGKRAVALSPERSLVVWKLDESWEHFEFGDTNVHRTWIHRLSDDGETILTTGDGFSELWKAHARKRILAIGTDRTELSSDGAWLAEATARTVNLYSVTDKPVLVATLQNRMEATKLLFSSDSRYFLTRDDFGRVRLWNVPHGDLLCVVETDARGRVQFSPDGQGLLFAEKKEEVRFWPFNKGQRTSRDLLDMARFLSIDRPEAEAEAARISIPSGKHDPPISVGTSSVQSWRALRQVCPELFTVTANEVDAWERHEALRCESGKAWSNAVVHLTRLLETHPGSGDFLPRRAAAYFAWAKSLLSLAPGFNPVTNNGATTPAASTASLPPEAVKTAPALAANNTGLKPGANERALATNLLERALVDYNLTLAWVDRFPGVAATSRKYYLPSHSRVLRSLGRTQEARADLLESGVIVPRAPGTSPNLIDLTASFNDARDMRAPSGVKTLSTGVEYDLRGTIRLVGGGFGADEEFPPEVVGIPIGRSVRRLHFLHDADVSEQTSGAVATLVVHLVNGQTHAMELRLGDDVWYGETKPGEPTPAHTSRIAFETTSDSLRLFQRTWENPTPNVAVDRVDFIAGQTDAYPVLYAITVEP